MALTYSLKKLLIILPASAGGPLNLGIITASGYLHYLAHLFHPKLEAVLVNELISYFRGFAKMAAAFFRMAFSSRKSWFSRFNRRISSSSGLRRPLPRKEFTESAEYSLIHRRRVS